MQILATANGIIECRHEVDIYVEELDTTITALVVQDAPTLISLGRLCLEHGYDYIWKHGQVPFLQKGDKTVLCQPSHNVPMITPAPLAGGNSEPVIEPIAGGDSELAEEVDSPVKRRKRAGKRKSLPDDAGGRKEARRSTNFNSRIGSKSSKGENKKGACQKVTNAREQRPAA